MSFILEHIENNPQETQRVIGLKYDSLQQLISEAEALHNQKQAEIELGKRRIIAKGGRKKAQTLGYWPNYFNFSLPKTDDYISAFEYPIWCQWIDSKWCI